MENFTRFENQYIMMLAIRAKQELEKEMKDRPFGYVDPNIESYIETLGKMAIKAKMNCQEYDKNKE